jgi:excisionase family DNA binding protein
MSGLLWSIEETARQMGGVSVRTVRRMIERGELPAVRVGRRVTIPAEAVRAWVENRMKHAHNAECAMPKAWKGESPCHTSAKIVPFGGSASPRRMDAELGDLLAQLSGKKRKHLKPSGSSKLTARRNGTSSPRTPSTN